MRPRVRRTVLTVHICASVALIGTTGSVLVVALTATGAGDDAHALYDVLGTLVFALAIPFSFISLGTGIALGLGTKWGVLKHRWVAAKLALQLAIIVTGALVVGPSIDAEEGGRIAVAGAANLAFAATAVGLSVFKPRGRLR
jgi:hypothetical protein